MTEAPLRLQGSKTTYAASKYLLSALGYTLKIVGRVTGHLIHAVGHDGGCCCVYTAQLLLAWTSARQIKGCWSLLNLIE